MKVIINGTEYVPVPFRPQTVVPLRTLLMQARKARALTFKEVTEATGLASSTICCAESSSSVSLLTAIKLCRFYQIELDTLADSVLAFEKGKGK